ncbi:hypothetical protein [Piscirickettsia litoralis]|uniref:Uncharacterized protein n=1 Tax=Piscirickettsia litoralis TaxID=1891921 RepID=A0ABX3A1E1_9GAMM|nr:hypothetical protein [Piscirickettsia litoralis]ODN41481.1 hypothetical protein BGC07_15310 [Piscirickettsia litoralis]
MSLTKEFFQKLKADPEQTLQDTPIFESLALMRKLPSAGIQKFKCANFKNTNGIQLEPDDCGEKLYWLPWESKNTTRLHLRGETNIFFHISTWRLPSVDHSKSNSKKS